MMKYMWRQSRDEMTAANGIASFSQPTRPAAIDNSYMLPFVNSDHVPLH